MPKVVLIILLFILSVLLVSSMGILLKHLYKLSSSYLKNKFINKRDKKQTLDKCGKHKNLSKKKFNIKVKFKEIITNPKRLFVASGVILVLLLIVITKSNFIHIKIRNIADISLAVIYIILMVITTISFAKNKSVQSKLQSLMMIFVYVIALALVPIMVFSKSEISSVKNALSFIVFLSMICFTVFVAAKYYYKKMAVLVLLGAYLITILVGSIAFGEFYWNHYPVKFVDYIDKINKTKDLWLQTLIVIKMGLRGFFEFPEPDVYCKLSFFQFMVGKIIDVMLLGYVASQFSNIKSELNKNK